MEGLPRPSPGIPCDLASLARVPLRFAKGRAPFVVWTFPRRTGETLIYFPCGAVV